MKKTDLLLFFGGYVLVAVGAMMTLGWAGFAMTVGAMSVLVSVLPK